MLHTMCFRWSNNQPHTSYLESESVTNYLLVLVWYYKKGMINREHNHGTQNIKSFRHRVIKGPTRQQHLHSTTSPSLSLAFSLSNSINPLFCFFLYPHQTHKHNHPSSSYPFMHPHPHTIHAHNNNNNNNNFHTHTHFAESSS